MIDLDDFRTINNTYGHQAGDTALTAVAAALRQTMRASDVPARYGGDEFAGMTHGQTLPTSTVGADVSGVRSPVGSNGVSVPPRARTQPSG